MQRQFRWTGPNTYVPSEIGPNNQRIMDDRYSFQYDAEGNLWERMHHRGMAVDTFTWDHRNRLTGVSRLAPREWVQFDIEGSHGDRLVDYLGNSPGYALSLAGQGSSSASSQLIFAFSDGVQVDSFPFTETQPWGPVLQPLVLGAKSAGSSDYFKGQLDDVRFVPYALDGAQHFLWMMQNPYPATLNTLLVNYAYDHQNRLISRTADPDGLGGPLPAVTEYFVHDGPGQSVTSALLAEDNLNQVGQIVLRLDAAGHVLNRYVWGPGVDQLVADEQVSSATSAGDTLWALSDHLGTIRDLVRYDTASQTVESVVHRTYDSFGNITNEINPEAVDVLFGYTSRPFDSATGLQNNLNRWYDPRPGRWISEGKKGDTHSPIVAVWGWG